MKSYFSGYLMRQLHGYLKEDIPPERALQLAKKDLLNNFDIGSQYKTPNYWANFIYVGKLHPQKASVTDYLWVVGVALMIMVTVIILKTRRKSDSKKVINIRSLF